MKLKILRALEYIFLHIGHFFKDWADDIDTIHNRLRRSMQKQQKKRVISKSVYDDDYFDAMEKMEPRR